MKSLPLASLAALALATALTAHSQTAHLTIHNPLPAARPSEVLDLPLTEVARHIKADPKTIVVKDHGTRLLTQVYASQPNQPADRLLILVDLTPSETKTLDLTSDPNAPALPSKVTARKVPERMDDFAWENDKVAFRVYGPALERTGEIASGIDVWSKRVPDFVTTSWYKRDEDSQRLHNPKLSYHHDNGQGQDSYEVGASRGDGGTAIWANGKLYASKNVVTSTILANGPIRTDFIFTYAPWGDGGRVAENVRVPPDNDGNTNFAMLSNKLSTVSVTEVKRITLDAGSRMNFLRSTFTVSSPFPGEAAPAITVAAGLAIHDGALTSAYRHQDFISVWDTPQSPAEAGRIATGLVTTPGSHPGYQEIEPQGKVDGNALELYPIHSGDSITYYAGNGWSHADMPTFEAWNNYLSSFRDRLTHPVTVRWSK